MDKWPVLVNIAKDTLQSVDSSVTTEPENLPLADVGQQFAYDTISHLWASVKDAKAGMIRSNVMVAAMFIKHLMGGHLDLPPTLDQFYETVCGSASRVPTSWNRDNQVIQWLRLPLQIALAISPLCLLLPARLALKDVARDKLMNVGPIPLTFPVVYLVCRPGGALEISGLSLSGQQRTGCGFSCSL